jgi:tRNA(Ile)-lysidine synthase
MLESRWPAAIQRLSRSAGLAGEAQVLLDGLAESDLGKVGSVHRIEIASMKELDEARQRNLLRYAIRQLELQLPPSTRLSQIVDELVHARQDAQPLVSWPGAEVRRYRGHIYLLAASPANESEAGRRLTEETPLDLGPGMGCLSLARTDGPFIDSEVAAAGLTVHFRMGGESIRPVGHEHSQKLKKLLQDAAVVPWMRERIPLLYSGDDLVAVADLWTAAEFSNPKGYRVCWHKRPEIN